MGIRGWGETATEDLQNKLAAVTMKTCDDRSACTEPK